jgi:hypothetical protein
MACNLDERLLLEIALKSQQCALESQQSTVSEHLSFIACAARLLHAFSLPLDSSPEQATSGMASLEQASFRSNGGAQPLSAPSMASIMSMKSHHVTWPPHRLGEARKSTEKIKRAFQAAVVGDGSGDGIGTTTAPATLLSFENVSHCLGAIDANAFNIFDASSSDVAPASSTGKGVFPEASLLNHSCLPNCSALQGTSFLAVVSMKPVASGEELTISYLLADADSEDRLRMRDCFHFECDCFLCQKAFASASNESILGKGNS